MILRNHSNMLICCSLNIFHEQKVELPNIFVETDAFLGMLQALWDENGLDYLMNKKFKGTAFYLK